MAAIKSPHPRSLVATLAAALAGWLLLAANPAAASSWANVLAAGSHGEAEAQALPSAPSGVAAACTKATATTIKVSWTAVPKATTYSAYKSTTSASSGYTLAASGVTLTSWTSPSLAAGTYWFETTATIGSNWVSLNSAASGSHIITSSTCT